MALSPQGPLYAGSASAGADWSNVSYATGAPNGNYAVDGNIGPGGGGNNSPTTLNVSNFGFSIPSNAIIDGIVLQAYVESGFSFDQTISLTNGSGKNSSVTPGFGQEWLISTSPLTWGSPTSTWGVNWTPADINGSGFGASLLAYPSHSTDNIGVDSVMITVYWHTAPTKIPKIKYYIYQVFDAVTGNYLGNLPNVSSDFAFSQDINTAGSQITVDCGISADTSSFSVDNLTDESGNSLTDERLNQLTDEGQLPFTGIGGSNALIRNGNTVKIYEIGYYYPNGKLMFSGKIERHIENFGGDTGDTNTKILIYADGQDMMNHLIKAGASGYTLDQSQTTQNTTGSVNFSSGKGTSFNYYGQSWKVGGGITNLGAISVLLNGTASVTVSVYTAANASTPLTSITQSVSVGSPTEVQFTFPSHISVTAGTTYFFAVTVAAGQSITIYYDSSTIYSFGSLYQATYGGGSGGGLYGVITGSLYFKTFSTTGSTTANFTSLDPSTMLTTIINDYQSEGGLIGYTSSSIQTTGLSLTYGVNTTPVFTGLQGILSIAPADYYFYVDIGYDILYFQQANTVADYVLTKGVHINKLAITSTMEYVVNACYVVGGPDPGNAGYNIYTYDSNVASIANYGLQLLIHTDSNITTTATAHAVGSSLIAESDNEQYQTTVSIPAETMDITLLTPGKIIGFNGFGTYVDGLLAQIVHRDYTSEQVTLQLGIIPTRTTTTVEQVTKGLIALSTIATNTNPSSPS